MNADLLNLLLADGWRDATDDEDDGERYVNDERGLCLFGVSEDDDDEDDEGDEDEQGPEALRFELWDYDPEEGQLVMLIWQTYDVRDVIRWLS
jgi:hypothetical protein